MRRYLTLPGAVALCLNGSVAALAQIATDGTLGPAGAFAGPNYFIPHTVGTLVGNKNLFHSFSTFNIGTGQSATFDGPASIQNILARVTGGTQSSIDGLLQSTITGANLYLMNPAGILFGPNMQINVPGAFHATTADYIKFSDGARFNANPATASSLSVADPSAFGFLATSPAAITLNGTCLPSCLFTLPTNEITLAAGSVALNTAGLLVPGGAVNLFAAGGPGEIGRDGTTTAPLGGSVTLAGGSLIDTSANGAGNVRIIGGAFTMTGSLINNGNTGPANSTGAISIRADNVQIVGNSAVLAGASASGQGAGISIQANALSVVGAGDASQVYTFVAPGAPGRAGDVSVAAGSLTLATGGSIGSATSGSGNTGNVTVSVSGDTRIDGMNTAAAFTGITSLVTPSATGDAGTVTVSSRNLTLLGRGQISGSTFGGGDAAQVNVAVEKSLLIDGGGVPVFTGIGAQANQGATGRAGAISVTAGDLTVQGLGMISNATTTSGNAGTIAVRAGDLAIRSGGQISSSTFAGANAGNIDIAVTRDLLIDGTGSTFYTGIASQANAGAGSAGTIDVSARSVTLIAGGQISSSTFTAGHAGTVRVAAAGTLLADGFRDDRRSGIFSQTNAGSLGNAGLVDIRAGTLVLQEGAVISSATQGFGQGGAVSVAAQDLTLKTGGQINASTSGSGNAGSVKVAVARDILIDATGSSLFTGVQSQTFDSGSAGSIDLSSTNLTLLGAGAISSSTAAGGNAGAVRIVVAQKLLIDGSAATNLTGIFSQAGTGSTGNAGMIDVRAGNLVLQGFGTISSATGGRGNGGSVNVAADGLTMSSGGQITSSTLAFGRGGDVRVAVGGDIMMDGIGTNVSAASSGFGDAGRIVVSAGGNLTLSGAAAISSSSFGLGNGGDVTVTAGGTVLLTGAETKIEARAPGIGNAGSITVAANTVELEAGAAISTEAALGGGGNIVILANELLYLLDSQITTSVAGGSGSGGDIFIDPDFVVLNHSRIIANAIAGNGGNITIIAGHFLQSSDSVVEASSQLGIDGQISISSPDTDLSGGLAQLPDGLAQNVQLSQQACTLPGQAPVLSLVPVGRGGLSLVPDSYQGHPVFLFAGTDVASGVAAERVMPLQLAQFQALPVIAPSSVECGR